MSNGKQTILAFVFVAVLMLGYTGVWYVDSYHQPTTEPSVIWETDSDVVFGQYTKENIGYSTWVDTQTSQNVGFNTQIPFSFYSYNRTAVYQGNNSYAVSFNTTTTSYACNNIIVMELPNADEFIITSINYSFTYSGESDIILSSGVSYTDGITNIMDYAVSPPNLRNTNIFADYEPADIEFVDGVWYNRTIDVPLVKGLEISDNAVGKNTFIELGFADSVGDGIAGHVCNFKIEITGENVSTYSKGNIVDLIVGISIIANIFVIIYLTDEIDIGGYVKDIRKRRK